MAVCRAAPLAAALLACASLARAQEAVPAEALEPASAPTVAEPGPRARPRLSSDEEALLARPDRQRFDDGPTLPLFGRPLIFGAQYTLLTRGEDRRLAKNGATLDYARLNQSLAIDVFYPYTEQVSVFLQGRLINRNLIWSSQDNPDSTWDTELGEAWLFLGSLFETPLSLQVGRQRIFDEREWWWDQEFDAVRLHFDQDRVHAQASVSDSLAPVSTDLDQQNQPEDQDMLRGFGRVMFEWAPKQQVGLYGLHQHDHSAAYSPGQILHKSDEDPSDGDLTWLGLSANGQRSLARFGKLAYWLDGAYVWGDETYYKFQGKNCCRELLAKNIFENQVRGWGLDVGATWELPLPGRPALTLSYARGSGQRQMTQAQNTGFRQTGVQNNNGAWTGVDRFKYYGEILQPDLSNLEILSAGIGLRMLRKSSIQLAYHYSRQVEAAPFLFDSNLSADPDGNHRAIGQEWDLILGVEEWKHVRLELIGGIFRAGKAFGPIPGGTAGKDRLESQAGDLSYLGIFEVRLAF